jgi:glycosyltransferase involved in cell wall biosynthesis
MAKLEVYHFHNGSGGGVLSVIRNILRYRQNPEIENHVIYTINKENTPAFSLPGLEGAASEQVFYFSSKWNFYYTCSKLAKLLPNQKALIVAHDWLELGMVSNLGLKNPVVFFVHGAYDYYYNLAEKHSAWIDNYITVANHISQHLVAQLQNRCSDISYLRFPVPDINCSIEKNFSEIKIIFAGRCEAAKGYTLLPHIQIELQKRNISVNWHIVGEGSKENNQQDIWPTKTNIKFHGILKNNELINLLCKSHILLLPSIAEGMPVVVIEAMKAGVVPIVNDLPCGVQELVMHNNTGYLVSDNKIPIYADYIERLCLDFDLMLTISMNAKNFANQLFNPILNTHICNSFLHLSSQKFRVKKAKKIYGSRLDQIWLPNIFVSFLRKLYS